jgi:VWFA-related protein
MAAIPMSRVRPGPGTTLVWALVGLAAATLAAQQVFRGRVDLVRVDVSVIDNRTGKPVTDLKAADFTVTENGTAQRIDAFGLNRLDGPSAPEPGGDAGRSGIRPHSRRVFMIVFGAPHSRLSFDGPYKVFDGTVRFLRERLQPGDLVSIMAFNRFTELTTDREAAIRLVERLRTEHQEEYYQKRIATPLKGVRADLSAVRQASIDRLMAPPGDTLKLRSTTDLIMNSRAFVQSRAWRPWNNIVIDGDALKVHAAVEYLRRVEGNKQLVVFAHRFPVGGRMLIIPRMGVMTESTEDSRFAAFASDAGVALNIVNVTGVDYVASKGGFGPAGVSDIQAMQTVAESSGGQYTGVRNADQQYERIDLATRSSYAIGYATTNPELDGKFRKITVSVNRPGVTIIFRHGYTARADVPPMDLRVTLTAQRFRQAAGTDVEAADIPLQAEAVEVEGKGGKELRITVRIDGSRLALERQGDRWVGEIDMFVLAGDRDEKTTGLLQQRMALGMDEARYMQATTTGIPYALTLPVSGRSAIAKVMVYEYASDKMGTVVARINGR